MWCPDCQKEVVFGFAGQAVQQRVQAGEVIWGGPQFPAPCPVCGNPLDWDRVLPPTHDGKGRARPRR